MAIVITPNEKYDRLGGALGLGTIGASGLCFKREDLHPYGSHKGRSIPVMIDHYIRSGDQAFAISSSGNAALAAALHIKKLNDKAGSSDYHLDIFIGNNIAPDKLGRLGQLADDNIRIIQIERPLQALNQASKEGKRSLRQSTDDIALIGYGSLAAEIAEIADLGAIFIGASSGTTAQALAEYFVGKKSVQVHIVQTSSCHPISDMFGKSDLPAEKSIADAIVDNIAYRKDGLARLVGQTDGRGWVATNDEIKTAQELVRKHALLEVSANGALPIVGVMKAVANGYKMTGTVLCLIGGK